MATTTLTVPAPRVTPGPDQDAPTYATPGTVSHAVDQIIWRMGLWWASRWTDAPDADLSLVDTGYWTVHPDYIFRSLVGRCVDVGAELEHRPDGSVRIHCRGTARN